jgi:hypothetical protein
MVTADRLKEGRHAREIVGELRWRGMSVPALYVRMADEFQDLVRSGDYAAWVTASQKPAVMDRRSHVADAPGRPMLPDRPAAHVTPRARRPGILPGGRLVGLRQSLDLPARLDA